MLLLGFIATRIQFWLGWGQVPSFAKFHPTAPTQSKTINRLLRNVNIIIRVTIRFVTKWIRQNGKCPKISYKILVEIKHKWHCQSSMPRARPGLLYSRFSISKVINEHLFCAICCHHDDLAHNKLACIIIATPSLLIIQQYCCTSQMMIEWILIYWVQ